MTVVKKMILLVLAGVNMAVFHLASHRTIHLWDEKPSAPPAGKIAARKLVPDRDRIGQGDGVSIHDYGFAGRGLTAADQHIVVRVEEQERVHKVRDAWLLMF